MHPNGGLVNIHKTRSIAAAALVALLGAVGASAQQPSPKPTSSAQPKTGPAPVAPVEGPKDFGPAPAPEPKPTPEEPKNPKAKAKAPRKPVRKVLSPSSPQSGAPAIPTLQIPKQDEAIVLRDMKAVREIIYNPDAVPEVNCGQFMVTTIVLPSHEQIVNVQAGNVDLWGITPIENKNVIFIKPTISNNKINIVAITRVGNIYPFLLTSRSDQPVLQMLRVLPPTTDTESIVTVPGSSSASGAILMEPGQRTEGGLSARRGQGTDSVAVGEMAERIRAEEQERHRQRERELLKSMLVGRNDDYKVSYDAFSKFRITHIYDASGVTYLRVRVPDNAQGMLYVIDEEGKRTLVPWTVSSEDPNVVMVDRVFRKAVVAVGKKEARIENRGFNRVFKDIKKEVLVPAA